MTTKQKYVEYLINKPINFTCTNMENHLEGVSYAAVSNYLKREKLTAIHLWESAEGPIKDCNDLDETITTQVAQEACNLRKQVVEFHCELKQLTASEKCQSGTTCSQRNHLACCYHVCVSLKVEANELGKSLDQVRADLFSNCFREQIRNPRISALKPIW